FDTESGQVRYTLRDSVCAPTFSLDGHWLITACAAEDPAGAEPGSTNGVQVRDTVTGQVFRNFAGDLRVASVVFSPDGKWVAAAADMKGLPLRERLQKGKVLVWDGTRGQLVHALTGACDCVAFSPDGGRIVSGSPEAGTVKLWDAATGQLVLTLRSPGAGQVTHLAFSPNGHHLAAMDDTPLLHRVAVWDATPPAPLDPAKAGNHGPRERPARLPIKGG